MIMTNINQIELQNIKHFIIAANTCNAKLTEYANATNDAQIKQLLTKGAQDTLNEKETLMTFLNR